MRSCPASQAIVENSIPWNYAVQMYPYTGHVRIPAHSASRTWYEGSHHLREAIREIVDDWDELSAYNKLDPVPPCPVTIDTAARERHQADYKRRMAYFEEVQELMWRMRLSGDGFVEADRYAEVKKMNDRFRAEWDEKVKGGPYPFQDGAPSWFVGS